jgi:hypothetical protein
MKMKRLVFALMLALGLGLAASGNTVAAPIAGAPIAQAASTLSDDGVQQVWYDQWGRWHPNRRRVYVRPPVVVAPPVYFAPRRVVPVCRQVWVCNRGICGWRTRCY